MTPRASECFSHSGKLNQQLRSLLRDGPLVHNQPHLCPCRHFWGAVPLLGLLQFLHHIFTQPFSKTFTYWPAVTGSCTHAPGYDLSEASAERGAVCHYTFCPSWPLPQSIPSGRMANSTGNMDHTSPFQWQLCHTSLGGVPLADLSLYSTIKRKKWKIEACFQNRALRNSENSDSTDFHMIYLN